MNPIRENLADLAEEVSIVDVYDRALRTSRRLGVVRVTVAGAAALLVLVALGAVGVALQGRQRALPPVGPPTSAPASSAPAPTSPAPSPTASQPGPDPSANANVLGRMTAATATTLPGRLFLMGGSAMVELANGQAQSYPFQNDGGCPGNTLTVSPDGSRVAFARGGLDGGGTDIVVVELANLRTTVIPGPKIWCAGRALWFTPDSASVIFYRMTTSGNTQSRVEPAQQYRLADGQLTAVTGPCCDVFSVGGGGFSASLLSGGVIVVKGSNGTEMRRCNRPTSAGPEVLVGLSADGRYATMANRPQDIGNPRNATRVVDTTTCQDRAMPTGGQVIGSIQFTANGGLVVIMRPAGGAFHARLLAADLSTVADAALPGTLAQSYGALGYIG